MFHQFQRLYFIFVYLMARPHLFILCQPYVLMMENCYAVKSAHCPLGIMNRHQEFNGVQRHDNTSFLHMWLLSHDNKPCNIRAVCFGHIFWRKAQSKADMHQNGVYHNIPTDDNFASFLLYLIISDQCVSWILSTSFCPMTWFWLYILTCLHASLSLVFLYRCVNGGYIA